MADVRAVALRPHPTASADILRVRNLLAVRLRALGLQTEERRYLIDRAGFATLKRWDPKANPASEIVNLIAILPGRDRVQPAWVVPAVLLTLVAVLIAGDPGRIDRQKTWLRIGTAAVIGIMAAANLLAAVRLVVDILTNNSLYAHNPGGLLAAGGVIWVTNVVAFALWYWNLDRGGANELVHR